MKIVLCILTYNEYDCLQTMLPKIPEPNQTSAYDDWCAIDGGSTDGTLEFFEQHKVPVIAQSKKGRGEAFLLAFEKIEADAYIFFSPDGNEDPNDFDKFRPYLEQGADVVIASRMMAGAFNEEDKQVFKFRKWVNNIFNFFANLLYRRQGPYITDSINGYRAITRKATEILKLDAHDHTIEYQMTIHSFKKRLNIVEFPTIEGPRIAGEIKATSLKTGLTFVRCFIRELFLWKF